jgi:hypothetical protein
VIEAVPAATPVTTPVEEFTEATDVLLLVHAPPEVELVSVDVAPAQADNVPPMDAGNAVTVATIVVLHPVDIV